MSISKPCPRCGAPLPADAPAGLCPACLMSAGVPSLDEAGATMVMEKGKVRDLPHVGETFGGYRIERELGHGGMGAVYAAEHLESGRRVALKVLSRRLDSPAARARFLREGRLAASINHPNSVYVFGTEEVEGTPVIAMELIAGGTLQDRVQRDGPLPVGEAVDAVLQIIAGLEAAQAIGILHRDIKPANCFEDAYGTVKVGDFGLSISTDARSESHLTLPGDFLGTPAFCSPEQMRGDELNVRSDMYAVGVTLYYLLTGHTPFEGKNMVQLLANALEKPAPPPTRFRPDIPNSLSQVVLRCLEKLPTSRYASYEELRRALVPFSASAPTPASLGLRFVAEVLDHLVFMVVNLFIPLLVFGDFMYLMDPAQRSSTQWMWLASGMFALKALYFAVLEGVWGATVGKAIVGLRVVRLNRGAPGVPRALGRFLLLTWPGLLNSVFYWYEPSEEPNKAMVFGILGFWVLFAIGMFSTVRRRNGFAAVHDLLTGTRVIQKAAYQPGTAATSVPATEVAATTTEAIQKVGPYDVLTVLSQGGGQRWLLGYDTRLLRKVWIRETHPGEPPVAAALRNVARSTRLRWLQGYRGDVSWDAYEAVEGLPLLALSRERQPWAEVRRWLHDLASELDAASKDGSMPEVLALNRVWITAGGGAKILDSEVPATPGASADASGADRGCKTPGAFLNQVAMAALEGRVPSAAEASARVVQAPLPIEARKAVRELSAPVSLSTLAESFRHLLKRPPEVSPWRRLALLMCCAAPALAAGAFMGIGLVFSQTMAEQNPAVIELNPCLHVYDDMDRGRKGTGMDHVPVPEAKAAMEIYIAGRFGPVVQDPKLWSTPMMRGMIRPEHRVAVERMVADHPKPGEEELARAQATLQPLLDRGIIQPKDGYLGYPGMGPFIVSGALGGVLLLTAILSVVCAFVFRGGLLLRMLGIAVVKNNGADASRFRMLWRSVIAWLPVLVYPLSWKLGNASQSHPGDYEAIFWEKTVFIAGVVGAAAILGLVSVALRGRGLQDRAAGTWLVPR